eukprot:597990-Ditylum_brightwellii.AAC.1
MSTPLLPWKKLSTLTKAALIQHRKSVRNAKKGYISLLILMTQGTPSFKNNTYQCYPRES